MNCEERKCYLFNYKGKDVHVQLSFTIHSKNHIKNVICWPGIPTFDLNSLRLQKELFITGAFGQSFLRSS